MFIKCWSRENFGQKEFDKKKLVQKNLIKKYFDQMLSSIYACLPSKVIYHQRLSSIQGHLQLRIIFN